MTFCRRAAIKCITFIVKGREQKVTNVAVFVCFSFDFKESPASCMWDDQNVNKPYFIPFSWELTFKSILWRRMR